jgi:hypothetical protein
MAKVTGSKDQQRQDSPMVDEMLDGGQMDIADTEDSALPGSAASLLSDLTANDRTAHADFQKQFGLDFFDDKDLNN